MTDAARLTEAQLNELVREIEDRFAFYDTQGTRKWRLTHILNGVYLSGYEAAQAQITTLTQERDELRRLLAVFRDAVVHLDRRADDHVSLSEVLLAFGKVEGYLLDHDAFQGTRSSPSRGSGEANLASATGTTPPSAQETRNEP